MKTLLAATIVVLCCLNILDAQDTIPKIKVYRAWVTLKGGTRAVKGFLHEVEDSSIVVSKAGVFQIVISKEGVFQKETRISNVDFFTIPYDHIITIKLRRRGKVVTGFLIGFFSGAIAGSTLGITSYNNNSGGLNLFGPAVLALMYSAPLVSIGSILGSGIVSKKIKIPINGDFEIFSGYRDKLKHYSIMNQNTYQTSRSKM